MIHATAAPEYRGRWLNRTAVRAHWRILTEYMDVDYALAEITSPLAERIWRGLGFNIIDHGGFRVAHITLPEKKNGGQPVQGHH